ncbi:MAG: RuBisCO large subunit C-terminal-like domain-containing protein [Candidatus Hodarchaeota archaeon]
MIKTPELKYINSITKLSSEKDEIRARYLIASSDFKDGKVRLITEALGYGVGQIASKNDLKIYNCSNMVTDTMRKELVRIINQGQINNDWYFFDVALKYNIIDFKMVGFSGLLSLLAGDVFGNPYVKNGLILNDIVLPNLAESIFIGPKLGSNYILEKCDASNSKFILGLLLKPDLGVDPEHYADLAEAAVQGGIHYIKEDELTLDSDLCRRLVRVEAISKKLGNFRDEIFYAANGTSPTYKIKDVCSQIINAGATAILINGLQVGFDAILHLASSEEISVPLHIHRAGYDIITSGLKAINTSCLTKLFRLSGGDIIHVGSPLCGIFSIDEVVQNTKCLKSDLINLRPSLPVFSRSSDETINFKWVFP